MRLLYNFGILLLGAITRLLTPFNPKAKLWVDGRKGVLDRMAEVIDSKSDIVWFHSASLGEFEQGRPLIEAFRTTHPNYKILLTFYSPSGYEIRKNYSGADYIFYLPEDIPRNVKRFMQIVKPKIVLFIKYEFWINYLLACRSIGARVFVISTIFRPNQPFFRWYGAIFRRALNVFEHIFVQNEESKGLLHSIGVNAVSVAGDTRFDRVYSITMSAQSLPDIERFGESKRVFIAGSTWPADEALLLRLINNNPDVKFIVAPHEIESDRINALCNEVKGGAVCYTKLAPDTDLKAPQLMVIDTIGILSSIYRYGDWAYIGGGFGAGIHNTLEAATFALPMAFGPRYAKFREACDLIKQGGAVSVGDFEELSAWFAPLLTSEETTKQQGQICRNYVFSNKGATEQILSTIDHK